MILLFSIIDKFDNGIDVLYGYDVKLCLGGGMYACACAYPCVDILVYIYIIWKHRDILRENIQQSLCYLLDKVI